MRKIRVAFDIEIPEGLSNEAVLTGLRSTLETEFYINDRDDSSKVYTLVEFGQFEVTVPPKEDGK